MSNTINIKVVESKGQIDEGTMTAEFFAKLDEMKFDRSAANDRIARAVHAVFDEFIGKRIRLPEVVSRALSNMALGAGEYGKWEARCLDYVRSNSQGKKMGASFERPNAIFVMRKGPRDAGVARRADLEASMPSDDSMNVAAE